MGEIGLEEAAAILLVFPAFVQDLVSYDFNGEKLPCLGRKPLRFDRSQVERYAEHLESKWQEEKRTPPAYVERYVKFLASGKCALCEEGRRAYDIAHVEPWAKSRCHSPHNLLHLCKECHADPDIVRPTAYANSLREQVSNVINLAVTTIVINIDTN